jgi:hypothetical protein
VYRHGPKVGVAEVLSQPDNYGALLRVAQGRGTEEDYRRLALLVAQVGGTGAILRANKRLPTEGREQFAPVFTEGFRTLHDLGEDDDY